MEVESIKMNNGLHIPRIGLGTWQAKDETAIETIKAAIDIGYRHFDCAMVYQNESAIGSAIRETIREGKVKREDVFITTKLWNTFHSPDLVVPACRKSLENLGLEYIDLYLIHWPCAYQLVEGQCAKNVDFSLFEDRANFFPVGSDGQVLLQDNDIIETWKAMEKCVELKLVKTIGLSNFNSEQIDRIWKNSNIKPAVLQVECHPFLNQEKLRNFCKERDIVVTGYSPLGSPSRPWAKSTDMNVLTNPQINEIARKIGKTPAQVILNYIISLNVIPLPKSANKQRLLENLKIFDFELSEEDRRIMDSLNCNLRYFRLSDALKHKDYPFFIDF